MIEWYACLSVQSIAQTIAEKKSKKNPEFVVIAAFW